MLLAATAGPAVARPATRPRRRDYRAWAASVLVHLAIVGLFMMTWTLASKGEPAPRRIIQGVMIVRSVARSPAPSPQPVAPAATATPAPQASPPRPTQKPAEPAKALPPPTLAPAPKPLAEPSVAAAAPPRVSADATATATPAERAGSQGESSLALLLNQVRENWLQPGGSRSLFHCRIRIDFRAGGIIANVSVLQGCGDSPLDDSVIRAVWKTQPLPVESARSQDGSVVLDFTP